ncbi:MAG: zinc ribbon domain-containing protein [Coriobacteriia bacterium]|nr:zinc ribbon domain-containing protein [Coriobacteriia bacterium]
MLCPNCQAEVRDGAAFCGSCGATIEQAPASAAVTESLPQPTAPMPGPDPAAQAAYQAQVAEYERQKAAYEQAQYAQQVAAYEQEKVAYDQQVAGQQAAYGAPVTQAAPPKKKTGLVVAIVIILILLLVGCSVGGFFAYKAWNDKNNETPGTTDTGTTDTDAGDSDTDGTDTDSGNALDSYATADEAVMAQLDASGVGDWVYQLYDEGDGYATYWAGPPNSEFVDEIYLEQNPDGTWSVIEVSGLDFGGDVSGSPADEAMWIVDMHLSYVQSDMGLEAQSLTVDPFRSDAASAAVSGGGFDYYSVDGYTEQSDGSFWVQTTQSWYGSVEGWEYWVVPTEVGYMIADLRYME